MKCSTFISGLFALVLPMSVQAETLLEFPLGTVQGFEEKQASGSLLLPVGPYISNDIETTAAEGTVIRRVWKTPGSHNDTLDLIRSLRSQLKNDGYEILYECETRICGGFDFRFRADVLDEPYMHVDLGDFRYLAASRMRDGKEEFVGLLVSRSLDQGFIQVTKVGAQPLDTGEVVTSTKDPEEEKGSEETSAAPAPAARPDGSLVERLAAKGSAVLDGLEFKKGSSDLSGSPTKSLQDLADYMSNNPGQKIVLVGHTDNSGSLERNVELSRERAQSVMTTLVEAYGANPELLSFEGIGYLSPLVSNATKEGRERNRRVEAVLAGK